MRMKCGFGVIELVVVTAVIAVLLAIGFVSLPRDGLALNQAASGLARNVQLARFEAIRQNTFVGLRIETGAEAYEMFRGRTYNDGNVFDTVRFGDQGSPRVRIKEAVGADDVLFDPRGMMISQLGTAGMVVTLQAGTQEREITISQHGRTSIQ